MGRSDVFFGDDDVVELDYVDFILRPSVGDVGLKGEGVGHESGGLAPIDTAPVALELAIDPEGLLAITLAGSVVFKHEFATDPFAFLDERLVVGIELIAPVFFVWRGFHLVPVAVEIPLSGGRVLSPVAPRFEGGRESIVTLRLESSPSESTPAVLSLEAPVRAQGCEVVNVVAFFIKARVESNEQRVAGFEPLGGPSTSVVAEACFGLQAALAKFWISARRLDEREHLSVLVTSLIPELFPVFLNLEPVGVDDRLVFFDAGIGFEPGSDALSLWQFTRSNQVFSSFDVCPYHKHRNQNQDGIHGVRVIESLEEIENLDSLLSVQGR